MMQRGDRPNKRTALRSWLLAEPARLTLSIREVKRSYHRTHKVAIGSTTIKMALHEARWMWANRERI